MSETCQTPELVHSETRHCSPVVQGDESKQRTPGGAAAGSGHNNSLVLTIGYRIDSKVSSTKKMPYVKRFVENGKVMVSKEKGTKKMKSKQTKESLPRINLGVLPNGKNLILYNCPMRSPTRDDQANSDTETDN
ncbi:hypothetical protein GCK72_024067 [Caenorhabditis remanei]|uniref:Uncharacterized protein n=1 Tax=Caenorhabditis remanei TaxID=31234 RepID=A0A6A5FYQ0_CAERE|nr:hypothetical protein GCK72_024067 [Caenorhabditis remanei]KAF1747602.1 hypothetical protein GCK72_024067 [Caenorhabditis remanei]